MNSSSKWKKRILRAGGCLVFWALAAVLFVHLNYLIAPDESGNYRYVMPAFYAEPEDSMDILLVGNSAAYRFVDTPWLWGEKGYTAYNLAFGSMPVESYRTMLEEAAKTQSPQLYLIEIRSFLRAKMKKKTMNVMLHRVADGMNQSLNRADLILRSTSDPADWLEYLFPIVSFHDLWENLSADSLEYIDNRVTLPQKGWRNVFRVKKKKAFPVYENLEPAALVKKSEKELRELLEYCREKQLPVVFFESPYFRTEEAAAKTLTTAEIIGEYGFTFWDLNDCTGEIGLDPRTDYYNTRHVNTFGARKFTTWLAERLESGGWISPAEHTPEVTAAWDRAADREAEVVEAYTGALEEGREPDFNEEEDF